MAFDFNEFKKKQGTTILDAPPKRKGKLQKVGEFLAPTATKTFGKLKEGEKASGRELLGSALEVGSFFLPVGAVGKGVGLGIKAAKTAKKAKKVKGAQKADEFEQLREKTSRVATKLKEQTKIGAKVGAVSGTGFGAGRALGDEDKSIPQVFGEAALSGVAGGVGGALLTPAISVVGMSSKAVANSISGAFRKTKRILNPEDRARTVKDVANSMELSFFQDRQAIINRLEKVGNRKGLTEKELIFNLVDEGYSPKVDGSLARFGGVIASLKERIGVLARGQETLLRPNPRLTPVSSIEREARKGITGRTDVQFDKALRQMDTQFKAIRSEFGENISAVDLSRLNVKMNMGTRSFKKGDFVQDTQNAIGGALRTFLDDIDPGSTAVRKMMGRLFTVRDTAQALNNQKIDAGFITQAMGRFIGVVGGAGAGFKIAGPGGLVVAGIMANLGAKGAANLIRQARFNQRTLDVLRQGVRSDAKLLQKLLREAKGRDKEAIRLLLPEVAGTGGGAIPLGPAGLGAGPGSRVLSGKGKGATPTKLSSLETEARKFKTADEFVESEAKFLHGTDSNKSIETFKKRPDTNQLVISFTQDEGFAKKFGANVQKFRVSPKKTFDFSKESDRLALKETLGGDFELLAQRIGKGDFEALEQGRVLTALKDAGFDSFLTRETFKGKTSINLQVFSNDVVQNEKQLTDIFNKAKKSNLGGGSRSKQ